MGINERGLAHVLVLIAAVGLIVFLLIGSTATFSDKLFAALFPKKSSFASGPITTPLPSVYTQASYYNQGGYFSASPSATPIATTSGSLIKIYAAGTPANGIYPTMQLVLAGRVAKTFMNINADPAIRPFTEYSYKIPVAVKITPDQVRINYTNDLRVGPGNDRNLFIDKINIDGVDYQSERPTTYSTGSWNFSSKACVPGNLQTEALVCNGYFEYR
jgi:hypothetical protein